MKRLVTVLMVLAMLAATSATVFAADAERERRSALSTPVLTTTTPSSARSLVAVAKSYGMNVVEVNSNYKPEKELANVQDLIAKGVDAIAVITAGAAGSAKSVEAANHAHVPIFFIAGKPDVPAGGAFQGHVTDNFVIMGYKIGQWVAKHYPKAKTRGNPGLPGPGSRGRGDGRLAARSR